MAALIFIAGALLLAWGAFVLVTGDYIATLDIAAGLAGVGVIAIALGGVVQALDRLRPGALTPPSRLRRPATAAKPPPPKSSRVTLAASIASAADAPSLIREGAIAGRQFRFYSDGSIESDTATGVRRYGSIDEVREEILSTPAPAAPEKSSAEAAADEPSDPWDRYLAAAKTMREAAEDTAAEPADTKADKPDSDTEPAASEDEDDLPPWSESFRAMLRRGRALDDEETPAEDAEGSSEERRN